MMKLHINKNFEETFRSGSFYRIEFKEAIYLVDPLKLNFVLNHLYYKRNKLTSLNVSEFLSKRKLLNPEFLKQVSRFIF